MNIEDARWETYEERFRTLAERAELVKVARPALDECKYYLCLYGENGLTPEEEFAFLDAMEREPDWNLKRLEVETVYWQDTVIFAPPRAE